MTFLVSMGTLYGPNRFLGVPTMSVSTQVWGTRPFFNVSLLNPVRKILEKLDQSCNKNFEPPKNGMYHVRTTSHVDNSLGLYSFRFRPPPPPRGVPTHEKTGLAGFRSGSDLANTSARVQNLEFRRLCLTIKAYSSNTSTLKVVFLGRFLLFASSVGRLLAQKLKPIIHICPHVRRPSFMNFEQSQAVHPNLGPQNTACF